MRCRKCLQELPADAALCHHCGTVQLTRERPVTAAAQIAQAPQAATGGHTQRPVTPNRFAAQPVPSAARPPVPFAQSVSDESNKLIFGILCLLVGGGIFAYWLPALSAEPYGSVSFREIGEYYDRSWLWWLAHAGIIGAGLAAMAMANERRYERAWWIIAGCALTLPYVFNLVSFLDEFGVDVRLGSGTWLAMLCFAGAAGLAWIALKRTE